MRARRADGAPFAQHGGELLMRDGVVRLDFDGPCEQLIGFDILANDAQRDAQIGERIGLFRRQLERRPVAGDGLVFLAHARIEAAQAAKGVGMPGRERHRIAEQIESARELAARLQENSAIDQRGDILRRMAEILR